MFTGLIQQVCTVSSLSTAAGGRILTIDFQQLSEQAKIGDSVAVNGVCLTVSKLTGTLAAFDLSGETLTKTNLAKLTAGIDVNVELPLRADERFGGHFVLGHIDGTATIKRIEKKGDFSTITFSAPKNLLEQLIPKGSVAIDGISLTVAELNTDGFTVAVIPQTLEKTTLGAAKTGRQVNLEIDIITKAVKKYLENLTPQKGLNINDLRQQGF